MPKVTSFRSSLAAPHPQSEPTGEAGSKQHLCPGQDLGQHFKDGVVQGEFSLNCGDLIKVIRIYCGSRSFYFRYFAL